MNVGRRKRTQGDEMDMTPMVDVTFLLLIFFMITSAFQMQKSFQVPTPRSDQASTNARTLEDYEEDPDYITVRVDEYSNFYVSAASWDEEEEAPSMDDLMRRLERAKGSDGPRASRLLVLANGDAKHERVVQAIDAGNEVGLLDVKLVTVEGDY